MAKDEYAVLVCRILSYLYSCLKNGAKPDLEYLTFDTKAFPICEEYWTYIIRHLIESGLIEGAVLVPIIGRTVKGVQVTEDIMITPDGIEYLRENGTMKKAVSFLRGLKEIVPGI